MADIENPSFHFFLKKCPGTFHKIIIPVAESFPSMGSAAHILQGLSGRISLALDASWAVCIQTPPCTISSCGTHQGSTIQMNWNFNNKYNHQ